MNALRLTTWLSWVLDFIAMAALAGTGEVRLELFAVVAALFVLSRSGFFKIPEKGVLGGMVALLLAAVVAWFKFRFHPIIAASYVAPLVHSFLFFAPETSRYRGWRIGIGFVQMILASSLAPDAYLFPAIFAFVLLASVAVSTGFLDEELSKRAPEYRELPLPTGYVRYSMLLAFLIFLTSLIIFPILPRMHMGGGFSDSFKVGYTEHVELSEKKGLNGREGTGDPVLRLYGPSGVDLSREIYLGLIRGRSLDIFDGSNWIASAQRSQVIGIKYVKPTETRDAIWVDADRSPLRSKALPLPYGTIQAQSGTGADDTPYPKTVGGEWIDASGMDSRVRYSYAFHPYQKFLRANSLDDDRPISADLGVPDVLKTPRMERLAKTLFSGVKDESAKINALTSYFGKERFSASLADAVSDSSAGDAQDRALLERMHPMERFLFINKQGHCEWFASSSVVLLRMAGVPARLVSGFRIAKGPVGGVLTITTNDAHAWVEYWTDAKGWTAFDPTPRLLGPSGFLNVFRDGYEWVSAYWYRYVLNFTESKNKKESSSDEPATEERPPTPAKFKDLKDQLEKLSQRYRSEILLALAAFIVISVGLYLFMRWRYPWIFSIRYRVREGGPELRRERMRMERLVLKRTSAQSIDDAIEALKQANQAKLSLALLQWRDTYQRLRFGSENGELDSADISQLALQYQAIKNEFRDSSN